MESGRPVDADQADVNNTKEELEPDNETPVNGKMMGVEGEEAALGNA